MSSSPAEDQGVFHFDFRPASPNLLISFQETTVRSAGKRCSVWRPMSHGTFLTHAAATGSDVSSVTSESSSRTGFQGSPRPFARRNSIDSNDSDDVSSITFPEGLCLPQRERTPSESEDLAACNGSLIDSNASTIHVVKKPRSVEPPQEESAGSDGDISSLTLVLSLSDHASIPESIHEDPSKPAALASSSGLVSLLLRVVTSVDAWWNRQHDLICIVLPLLYYTISITIAFCWQPEMRDSRLYNSIDLGSTRYGFPLSGWLLALCLINISSGASQCFTTMREVLRSSSWPWQERRHELLTRFYSVAPLLVFSVVLLMASADADDHHRRTRIATLVIWLVWALAFTVPCSALSIFVHPSEPILRPALVDPITIIAAVLILQGQAKTCGFIKSNESFLPMIVLLASVFVYTAGCLCLVNSMLRLWRKWRHNEPLPGRFYDVLGIATFLLICLNMYSFAGLGSNSRLVLAGTDIDFSVWLMLRMAPASVYLSVWAVRCNEISLQRALQEAKMHEAALLELDGLRTATTISRAV